MNRINFLLALITCLFTMTVKGQDSLSLYQKIEHQYQTERTFRENYYYNPANMSDYSNLSFSDLEVSFKKEKKQKYFLAEGSSWNGLSIEVNSFKILNKNRKVWGTIVYKNQIQREVQWNNNVDYKRIYPYVFADSTKGNNKFEGYEFEGGYSKEFDRWNVGGKIIYKAHLSYRNIDPRPKNVSSDMIVNIGASYKIFDDYKIGVYGEFNKYIQNTDVKFASEIQQAALYQMTGFGTWNYFFSQKSTTVAYSTLGFKSNITLSNNKAKDFAITASLGNYQLKKVLSGGFEINRLNDKVFSIDAIKSFYFTDHLLGIKLEYDYNIKNGTDILYSNNENYTKKLLEKSLYKYEDYTATTELLYQYSGRKFRVSAIPFYIYQQTNESLEEVNKEQNISYNYYGVKLNYLQELNNKNLISFIPYIVVRNVTNSNNKLNLEADKESIKNWLLSDFEVLSSNYYCFGTSLRYDFKVKTIPALYISMNMEHKKFNKNKFNNYFSAAVGASF